MKVGNNKIIEPIINCLVIATAWVSNNKQPYDQTKNLIYFSMPVVSC